MPNHATRIAKLEAQNDEGHMRFVWLNQNESAEDGWRRYVAGHSDATTAEKARAAGRVIFLSWTDARL